MRIIDLGAKTGRSRLNKYLAEVSLDIADVQVTVHKIIVDVRKRGDVALKDYARKFDRVKAKRWSMQVTEREIEEAYRKVDPSLIRALEKARARLEDYHVHQVPESWEMEDEFGNTLGMEVRALENVGVYVPGGRNPYPSSVLMTVVPGVVAGVENIYMTTPPQSDGSVASSILVAADIAGVSAIFKAGGAQAIAALAFGTKTVPAVDKVVGPGNIFVTVAKQLLSGVIGIDSLAGPSEILIMADRTARAKDVAADLLSQAEHDPLAVSVMVTNSKVLIEKVKKEINKQVPGMSRKEIIEESLKKRGAIILARSRAEMIDIANEIATEHLEIIMKDADAVLEEINNAGAAFVGPYSPVPIGDYVAGTNHVLPVGRTARFSSPLNVEDYIKRMSVIKCTKDGLKAIHPSMKTIATAEGYDAHIGSVESRFK